MDILNFELFSECFNVLENIEKNLSFDPSDGSGTASSLWETVKCQQHSDRYYNHLWYKFEGLGKRSALLLNAMQPSASRIIAKFRVNGNPIATTRVLLTVAHFVQNELGLPEIEQLSSQRSTTIWNDYDGCLYSKRNPVGMWKGLTADERAMLYRVVIGKIAAYAVRTVKDRIFDLPRTFYHLQPDERGITRFPIFDAPKGFIWCDIPSIDTWTVTDEENKTTFYSPFGEFYLSWSHSDEIDILTFERTGENHLYFNGQYLPQ